MCSISTLKELAPRKINSSVQETKPGNYNGLSSIKCLSRMIPVGGSISLLGHFGRLERMRLSSGWRRDWISYWEWKIASGFTNEWVQKVLEGLLWTRPTAKISPTQQLTNPAKVVLQLERCLLSLTMQMCQLCVIPAQWALQRASLNVFIWSNSLPLK